MKLKAYNLFRDGKFEICHHDLRKIETQKQHVIACWKNAQKYGNGYWFEKPFPKFEIKQ